MKLWWIGIEIYLQTKYQQIDLWQIYSRTIHKLFVNRELFAEHREESKQKLQKKKIDIFQEL